ncbi:hypothetical protein PLICRDRAFT_340643 [Plicaturopsis crispa FD-325 SS-3]|uniref:Uncharacterized protein n=1 Tax=Plicaturopsis crispa FD-325 SS-3 TaxID=944288 RepID=A0A0C9T956_PLICR|nr:hypothetical protein PLICRDRAFT_340643 [Plicaturopsis crispa FD-325 SS-3]
MPGRAGRREDISLSKVQGNRASVLSLRRTSTWTSQSNGGGLFRPTVLKKRVGLTVVVALLSLIAVILVLGLALERKTFGRINTANRYQHYLWTIPPVIVTVAIAAIVSSMDYSLKRLQPFVNLIKGDASADHSLLLDYVSAPRYLVWSYALKNKHWVVTCSTLATLFCALLSPLASSLFVAVPPTHWLLSSPRIRGCHRGRPQMVLCRVFGSTLTASLRPLHIRTCRQLVPTFGGCHRFDAI